MNPTIMLTAKIMTTLTITQQHKNTMMTTLPTLVENQQEEKKNSKKPCKNWDSKLWPELTVLQLKKPKHSSSILITQRLWSLLETRTPMLFLEKPKCKISIKILQMPRLVNSKKPKNHKKLPKKRKALIKLMMKNKKMRMVSINHKLKWLSTIANALELKPLEPLKIIIMIPSMPLWS